MRSRFSRSLFVLCRPAFLLALSLLATCATADDSNVPNPGKIGLRLPRVLYAVEGQETNLYFDNVVLTTRPDHYAFDVICDRGQQQSERWTWTPNENDIGSRPLAVEVRDEENKIIASGKTSVVVSAAKSGAERPLSILMVGDSLTHASIYPARVLALCQPPGNPRISLVGSFQPAGAAEGVRHEGYGGWTAQRFATHYAETARQGDYGKRGSPFIYAGDNGEKRLDFARYCHDVNGGKFPDVVTVFLGPNDIFSSNDGTIGQTVSDIVKYMDQLIAMVHSASPKTQVALMLPVPPAASQDAFGANYAAGQTRWQYKRNQHYLVEQMLATYSGREDEAIHLVPTVVNLDCAHNYPSATAPWNARNPLPAERQNNGVHPSGPGYDQIGDTLYAWLKHYAGQTPAH